MGPIIFLIKVYMAGQTLEYFRCPGKLKHSCPVLVELGVGGSGLYS